MKKFMFISILLIGVSAFAAPEKNLREVCDRVVDENKCFDAGAGNYLNKKALGICYNLSGLFGAWKIDCIKAIANKDYSKKTLRECEGKNKKRRIVRCLNNSGEVVNYNRGRAHFERNLETRIKNALKAYRNDNIRKMGRVMNRVGNKLHSRNGYYRLKDLFEKSEIAYRHRNYDRAARLLKAMRNRL